MLIIIYKYTAQCCGSFRRFIIKRGGSDTEIYYPYTVNDYYMQCRYNQKKNGAKIRTYKNVLPFVSEAELVKSVAENGPVSVAVDVSGFHYYRGYIYYESNCRNDASGLNHAVLVKSMDLITGLSRSVMALVGGDKMYIYMSRNRQKNCGIAYHPSYPIA